MDIFEEREVNIQRIINMMKRMFLLLILHLTPLKLQMSCLNASENIAMVSMITMSLIFLFKSLSAKKQSKN